MRKRNPSWWLTTSGCLLDLRRQLRSPRRRRSLRPERHGSGPVRRASSASERGARSIPGFDIRPLGDRRTATAGDAETEGSIGRYPDTKPAELIGCDLERPAVGCLHPYMSFAVGSDLAEEA